MVCKPPNRKQWQFLRPRLLSTRNEPNCRRYQLGTSPKWPIKQRWYERKVVPTVNLTHDGEDTRSRMSDIPLQLPASANVSSNTFKLVTFSKAGGDSMQNVRSLQPIPNQTGLNPWHIQYPVTCPQSVVAVLGPQEAVQLVKPCMISAKRFDVLCSWYQDNFLLPHIIMTLLRGETLSILWQEITNHRCANFPKTKGPVIAICSGSKSSSRRSARNLVTEVTSERWTRDEQVNDVRLHALYSEDVTQQQNQKYAGPHQHLTGLVKETQQYRETFEESRLAHSAAGPRIDRLRQREAELPREARRQNNDRAKLEALLKRNRTDPESRTSEGQQIICELRSEVVQLKASAVPPNLTRDLEEKTESQKTEVQKSSKSSRINAGLSEQWGWSKRQFDSRCLCWWKCCDIIRDQNCGTSNQSPTTSWWWLRAVPTERAFNAESSTKFGLSSENATSEHLESSTDSTQFIYSCDFLATAPTVTVEDAKRKRPNNLLLRSCFNRQCLEVGKSASHSQAILRSIQELLCYG